MGGVRLDVIPPEQREGGDACAIEWLTAVGHEVGQLVTTGTGEDEAEALASSPQIECVACSLQAEHGIDAFVGVQGELGFVDDQDDQLFSCLMKQFEGLG
ncbi:hypothetical protein D3C85_1098900 [compost metagenome]